MKKNKLRKLVKAARKGVRKNIEQSLVTELKTVTVYPGQDQKKLEKGIEKGSKKLAKKLSKTIRIDKSTLLEAGQKIKEVKTPVAPQPAVARPTPTAAKATVSPGTRRAGKTTRQPKPAATAVKPVHSESENIKG